MVSSSRAREKSSRCCCAAHVVGTTGNKQQRTHGCEQKHTLSWLKMVRALKTVLGVSLLPNALKASSVIAKMIVGATNSVELRVARTYGVVKYSPSESE